MTFADLVYNFIDLLNLFIPLIFALTILVLIWKIVDAFIINGEEPQKRKEGRQVILIGFLVLVVMVGIWGILALLRSSIF